MARWLRVVRATAAGWRPEWRLTQKVVRMLKVKLKVTWVIVALYLSSRVCLVLRRTCRSRVCVCVCVCV